MARVPYLREDSGGAGKTAGRVPYLGGGRSGGGSGRVPYLGQAQTSEDGFSVGGLLTNFAEGARSAVLGLPRGLAETAKATGDVAALLASGGANPINESTKEFGRAIAQSYRDTYGNGLRGLYENPFGVTLDLLTVGTLGAGAAAKVGLAPARATELTTASGNVVRVARSRRGGRRLVQAGADVALKQFGPGRRVVGEFSRAGRAEARTLRKQALAQKNTLVSYDRLARKLRRPERVAAPMHAMLGGSREAYDALAQGLLEQGSELGKVLSSGPVRSAFLNPSPRMRAVVDEMREVAERQRKLVDLDTDVADARTFLPLRLAEGAKFVEDTSLFGRLTNGDLVRIVVDAEGQPRRVRRGQPGFYANIVEPAGVLRTTPSGRGFQQIRVSADDLTPVGPDDIPFVLRRSLDKRIEGGPSLDELRARVAAGDIEQPIYFPHAVPSKSLLGSLGRGGGTGPQQILGSLRQNKGVLLTTGQLAVQPEILSQSFLRAVKWDHYGRIHDNLLANGQRVGVEDAKRVLREQRGWRIVREDRRQRVAPTVRQAESIGDYLENLGKLGDFDFERGPLGDLGAFVTRDVSEAAKVGGQVVLVPDAYVDALAGEFTRTSRFAFILQRWPVRVWRALVLNLRPAWLVNNILGNSLLYAIGQGDARGAQALLTSFKRTWPRHANEFEQLFRKHFPEQAQGTFIGTQRPTGFAKSTLGRFAGKVVGSLADVDKWYETVLRRAAVKAELRRHPELRKRVNAMRSETRDFMQAADKALDADPGLTDDISRRVNDALGDFTNLSPFERDWARSFLPFYAWLKAITIITLKLPLEHPLKANALSRLGEIGAETNLAELGVSEDEVPAFLRSFIPTGEPSGGRVPGFQTGPSNPFGSTVDVGEFVNALIAGRPGAAGRELPGVNPFLSLPVQTIFGINPATGAPLPDRRGGVIRNTGQLITEGLPEVRVANAFLGRLSQGTPSRPTLYDRDQIDELLGFLGVPRKRVSLKRAEQLRR